jgi:serine phosphatase RsbU (regulator of sigma subunit)
MKRIILIILLFEVALTRGQNQLTEMVNKIDSANNVVKDSIFKKIITEKNDTLLADLYFELNELTEKEEEGIFYANKIIALMDAQLKKNNKDIKIRNSYLNRKALALRTLYFIKVKKKDITATENLSELINLFKATQNYQEVIQGYIYLSQFYMEEGNLLKQFEILNEANQFAQEKNFLRGISRCYVQYQLFYTGIGDTTNAIEYIEKAIALEKKIADPTREARGYYLAGLTYSRMGKSEKAIEYFKLSVKSFKKENMQQKDRIWQTYVSLGEELAKVKKYDEAEDLFNEIIKISSSSNEIVGVFRGLLSKGSLMALKKNYPAALNIHNNLLTEAKKANAEKQVLSLINYKLAEDYFLSGDYPSARENITNSLELMDDGPIEQLTESEELAYKIDSASKNYEGALKHFYKLTELKSKMNKAAVAKSTMGLKFKSDLNQLKAEKEKQKEAAEKESKIQKIMFWSVISIAVLLSVVMIMIYKSLTNSRKSNIIITQQKQEAEEQKILIEEKQKEIKDSITYALRLQQAILPPVELINSNFKDNFILYLPKDIVAGDFYWAEQIDGLFFIAAADSTGHGVPGALVSVVCSNALNRSVNEFKLTMPGEILDKTRELVIDTLSRSNTNVKDGMDASLLCIDRINKKIYWSGANNPLWYMSENSIKEIKPDKQPIGKSETQKPFTTHALNLKEGDCFYLFTDGYADQFGGPKGKKFKYKQLEEILVSVESLAMQEQAKILKDKFETWKGELEQVDDVCVIGIRI